MFKTLQELPFSLRLKIRLYCGLQDTKMCPLSFLSTLVFWTSLPPNTYIPASVASLLFLEPSCLRAFSPAALSFPHFLVFQISPPQRGLSWTPVLKSELPIPVLPVLHLPHFSSLSISHSINITNFLCLLSASLPKWGQAFSFVQISA